MNVNLLVSTFAKIEPQADRFATNFYQILFDLSPEIDRLMSRVPPQTRRTALLEYLKLMVDNADNERAIQFIFRNLGQKYAIEREILDDYSLVGAALFQSFKDCLMEDWTPDVERSWQLIFQTTANAAIDGARSIGEKDAFSISNRDEDASDSLVNLLPQMLTNIEPTVDRVRPVSKSNARSMPFFVGAIVLAILIGGGYLAWSQNRSSSNKSVPVAN